MSQVRIRLTPRNLSELVWEQWIETVEEDLPRVRGRLHEMFEACEGTRSKMDYNTGSITLSAAMALYLAVRNTVATSVFEVGTFIGKSTVAMALAMEMNKQGGQIFTCDGSNDFHVPKLCDTPIHGFSKTTSTAALEQLAKNGVKLDMLHLDGRLSGRDVELIEQISDPRVVLAIDDFEGVEKGVANLSILRGRPFFGQHILVYPMRERTLSKLSCITPNTTALLVPMSAVTFTYQ